MVFSPRVVFPVVQDYYKHGPHPFDWILGRMKGTFRNPWKEISSNLSSFFELIRYVVGDGFGTYIQENRWLGDRPRCNRFPHHLSAKKNCFVADVLLLSGSSLSFLFGFRRHSFNRKMNDGGYDPPFFIRDVEVR